MKNFKFQIPNFKSILNFKTLNIYLAFVIWILTFSILIQTSVYAIDATPSSIVQSKLDELKKEIASKAAALKQQVNKDLQNKAFVGVIKSKSATSLTVAAKSGSKIINTNQDTAYSGTILVKNKKTTITFDSLKEETAIAALGDIDDTGVLTAKKIILLPPGSNPLPKNHLWGEITSSSGQNITIKLKDSQSKSILVSGDTNYKLGVDDATFSDIKTGRVIIVSGKINEDQIMNASFIYIIPQGPQTPKPSQTASASATPKASPTAKPTKSPKPTATP